MTRFQKANVMIDQECSAAFKNIREDVARYYSEDYNPEQARVMLRETLPQLALSKTGRLIDSSFDYLMDEAAAVLEGKSVETRTKFREHEFKHFKNGFHIDPDEPTFSARPKYLYAVLGFGIGGTGVAAILWILARLSPPFKLAFGLPTLAFLTLIGSVCGLKMGLDKGVRDSRERLEASVENYVSSAEKTVHAMLQQLVHEFESEFDEFCDENGIAR